MAVSELTPDGMRIRLQNEIDRCGGLRQFSHRYAYSVRYLEKVLEGSQEPSPSLAVALGLRKQTRVEVYYTEFP